MTFAPVKTSAVSKPAMLQQSATFTGQEIREFSRPGGVAARAVRSTVALAGSNGNAAGHKVMIIGGDGYVASLGLPAGR